MSTILYPVKITEENRERIYKTIDRTISRYFVRSALLPENSKSLSRADSKFGRWMMAESVDVDKSIDSFLNGLPQSDLVNRIKTKVAAIRNLTREMACDNSEQFTNEKFKAITDAFTALTADDSFHKDLDELNRTTGFRYVKNNEFKALLNMGLRLDHAASDFERLAIKERNAEISRITQDVKSIDANVLKYEAALKKQVEALKASGESISEDEIPAAIEEHERIAGILAKDAEVEKKRVDHYASDVEKSTGDLEKINHAIYVHEKGLADLDVEIKKVTDAINEQTLSIASDSRLYEQYKADMGSLEKRKEGLRNASARDIILEGDETGNAEITKYQQNEKTIGDIEAQSKALDGISGYSVSRIRRALDNTVFLAEGDNPDTSLIRGTIREFKELYDKYSPDTVTEKGGFFSSNKVRRAESSEFVQKMLLKHADDTDSIYLIDDLKQACERMKGSLAKENEKISKKDVFRKAADQLRERKIKLIERQQGDAKPLYEESEKKVNYNEKMLAHQRSQLSSFLKAKTDYDNALSDFRKGAADKQAEIDAAMAKLAEAKQRVNSIEKDRTAHLDTAEKLKEVITLGKEAKKLQKNCTDQMAQFKENSRQLPEMHDNRRDKISSRLSDYIARKDETKRWFGNTTEYNDLFVKLQQARDASPENLAESINQLEKAATHYIQQKGSRTIFATKTRHARLNLARDIQSWCLSVKDSLAEKTEAISPEVEEHARAYRSGTFAMGIVSKIGLDLAMNLSKPRERSASFSEKSLNKTAEIHKDFQQPQVSQKSLDF